ncbi:hypothetical protein LSH36_360g02028 [Paralvinella palmiformis]|uniref:Uncharacterized protein n=1 Tax=Paralvinella palmiformis TaxID=53620 RepID=A0AAD9MZH0_9ANNE|nr:hypothetical protein LSH36_360g02028 [Paralvinella palmiformis]
MDFVRTVVNEIALEGLDGITLSGLWLRLANCEPSFTLNLDADSKEYIWTSVITRHSDLTFFLLEKPRPPLLIIERGLGKNSENIPDDLDFGEDPYPYQLIQDGDVVGSCSTYYTRQNVTEEIRPAGGCVPSLDDVMKKYVDRLVIVASQDVRRKVLLNDFTDQGVILTEKAFCLLEKIGRSRYSGSTTHGKASISKWISESNKFIFYLKNKLCRLGLITSQRFLMYRSKSHSISGKILHLKKFYVEVRPRSAVILEKLTRALADKPKQLELLSVIKEEMKGDPLDYGSYQMIKLLKHGMKVLEGFGEKTKSENLEKAFKRLPREVSWWSLKNLGVEEWLVNGIMIMYDNARTPLKTKHSNSEGGGTLGISAKSTTIHGCYISSDM